jgi:phosphomannomutase / phosphoglucomutase
MIKVNPNIFRQYDIRGDVGTDLTPEFAHLLGRAYAGLLKEENSEEYKFKKIAIGFDCRLSSKEYAESLAKGISDEGIDVVITGMGPTPQLYFALFELDTAGGIQVTGSHNPSSMNGFKLCIGKKTLSGEQITNLYHRIIKLTSGTDSGHKGKIEHHDLKESYLSMLIHKIKPRLRDRKVKVVVDAGNGMGSEIAPAVLKALGADVIELYCHPDGNFPNHHPDPSEPDNLEDLIKTVKKEKADFGVAFDGDADRLGIVDEQGEIIFGDLLLLIFARAIVEDQGRGLIVGDVKCSQRVFDDIQARGGEAIMWKTGHSLIKAKLRETNAELAGEMSGHVFFNDDYYGFDDAIYAACRFMEIFTKRQDQVSEFLNDLPTAVSTPEIRVDCPDEVKFKIAEHAKEYFKDEEIDTTDGVRINFGKGWGLLRASNTQPVLVLRFEAETQELLNRYQLRVTEVIEEIRSKLNFSS